MHINPHLQALPDFPFDRLHHLLDGIAPPPDLEPISLAVGEPQQSAPAWVSTIVADHHHLWNKYPPFAGSPELRQSIADYLCRRYGLSGHDLDARHNVLACAGTREALYLLPLWAVPQTKAGNRPLVAMPNPFYHVYGTAARASGAESLYLSATPETGHLPDLGGLSEEQLNRMAVLFLCSPANPQGTIAPEAWLQEAVSLARKHDFLLIVDECYAGIYDHTPPPGALEVCRKMADRSAPHGGDSHMFDNVIVFHSLSKRSSSAGLRSGFLAGDRNIIQAHGRFRSYICATIPGPLDAAATALWQDDDHVEHIRAFYRRNIDVAEQILGQRFGFYRPPGGFFLWLEVGNGEEAARTLWREAAVRVLPGTFISSPFMAGAGQAGVDEFSESSEPSPKTSGDSCIRVALVHDPHIIAEACERIVKVL